MSYLHYTDRHSHPNAAKLEKKISQSFRYIKRNNFLLSLNFNARVVVNEREINDIAKEFCHWTIFSKLCNF